MCEQAGVLGSGEAGKNWQGLGENKRTERAEAEDIHLYRSQLSG